MTRRTVVGSALCCLTLTSTGGFAQETPGAVAQQSVDLEEIVVTAQRREERLLDVPMSIVAVSDEELHQRQITNIDDLALAVPGIQITNTGWQRRMNL